MTLQLVTILQVATGVAWAAIGLLNLVVLLVTGGEPLFGWWVSLMIGAVLASSLAVVNSLSMRRALADALPAAGVPIASPAEAVGRCIGPVALAVFVLVVLAVIPGAREYQGLAAMLFACIGVVYVPLAGWVRRFEEQQGVIVAQLVNRYGMRSELRIFRLPR